MIQRKFSHGRLLMTPGARDAVSNEMLMICLGRHLVGDWGDVCHEDGQANEDALQSGDRLLSVYKIANGCTIWIITEAVDDEGQRVATTVLLPEEY